MTQMSTPSVTSSCSFYRELGAGNLKSLCVVLQFLQKISKECTLEKTRTGEVILRCLNETKSVFACVKFRENFWNPSLDNIEQQNVSFSCKLSLKLICGIFRNFKLVQCLCIAQRQQGCENHMIFQFRLSDSVTKTHFVSYQDNEVLNAVFDEESTTVIQSQPQLFLELFEHLTQAKEFIISASTDKFYFKSIIASSNLSTNVDMILSTDLKVDIEEFDLYQYCPQEESLVDGEEKTDIVFTSKEFKAMLSLCDSLDIPSFSLYFSSGGNPLKLRCEDPNGFFSVEVVSATLEGSARNTSSASTTNFRPTKKKKAATAMEERRKRKEEKKKERSERGERSDKKKKKERRTSKVRNDDEEEEKENEENEEKDEDDEWLEDVINKQPTPREKERERNERSEQNEIREEEYEKGETLAEELSFDIVAPGLEDNNSNGSNESNGNKSNTSNNIVLSNRYNSISNNNNNNNSNNLMKESSSSSSSSTGQGKNESVSGFQRKSKFSRKLMMDSDSDDDFLKRNI